MNNNNNMRNNKYVESNYDDIKKSLIILKNNNFKFAAESFEYDIDLLIQDIIRDNKNKNNNVIIDIKDFENKLKFIVDIRNAYLNKYNNTKALKALEYFEQDLFIYENYPYLWIEYFPDSNPNKICFNIISNKNNELRVEEILFKSYTDKEVKGIYDRNKGMDKIIDTIEHKIQNINDYGLVEEHINNDNKDIKGINEEL